MIPILRIVWIDPLAEFRAWLWRSRRNAWEAHTVECQRCMHYATNDEPVTPCAEGRVLLDRMYPDTAEKRRVWFAKKDAGGVPS